MISIQLLCEVLLHLCNVYSIQSTASSLTLKSFWCEPGILAVAKEWWEIHQGPKVLAWWLMTHHLAESACQIHILITANMRLNYKIVSIWSNLFYVITFKNACLENYRGVFKSLLPHPIYNQSPSHATRNRPFLPNFTMSLL